MENSILQKMILPDALKKVLDINSHVTIPRDRDELLKLALGNTDTDIFEVGYDVPGKGYIAEAHVTRCKNGLSINYVDTYMRRRDPKCMVIADTLPTDKTRYEASYGQPFDTLREQTFEWFKTQELLIMPFLAGHDTLGYEALLVAPKNTGFFAGGLADLQGFIPYDEIREGFEPKAIIYVAPPFRHTHFDGKQVVVHNRLPHMHELFSYNLYPGPSAKKGIYGVLLNIGEEEGWVTAHASSVKIVPHHSKKAITIMHEGASGGGKSEMIEQMHRQTNGLIHFAKNTLTKESIYLDIKDGAKLYPITDDMALCHPNLLDDSKKLVVTDAENGWFLRVNHITQYGTDPHYEKLTIHPPKPLIFLNMEASPHATCLIWNHTMDAPGMPCPNPRVIVPRSFIPNIVNEPVAIDARSFGVRTPSCTSQLPSYGILGMMHILPPALGWLWRLVAPRGHANPSIISDERMRSEGVGSYWPFATGRKVDQANLLLKQIKETPNTRYFLIPNQNVGAYEVGFMSQWMSREYLTRRESVAFNPSEVTPSRCALLGYSLAQLSIDGYDVPKGFLEVNKQDEVGDSAYDEGASILTTFFKKEITKYLDEDLDPLGKAIIECCLNDGTLEDYLALMPMKL